MSRRSMAHAGKACVGTTLVRTRLVRTGLALVAVAALNGAALNLAGLGFAMTTVAWSQAAQEPAASEPKATKKAAAKKPSAQKQAAAGDPATDPAGVQKALDAAQKSLDAGKADVALNQANALISTSKLEPRSMARALALRGHANMKLAKPAQAISDLQSALWLSGGLSETERSSALQARSQAYREAGLGDAPPIVGVKAANSSPIATAALAPRPTETAAPAGGVGNFFSKLFSPASKADTSAPSQVSAPISAPVSPAISPAVSSWSETTTKAAPPKSDVKPEAKPKPQAAAAASSKVASASTEPGPFRLQLGAVRSRDEAQSVAQRVKQEFGDKIGQRAYDIDETVFGNMGTFYRVRIGPFAEASEPKGLCQALRGKGVDCMLISK